MLAPKSTIAAADNEPDISAAVKDLINAALTPKDPDTLSAI